MVFAIHWHESAVDLHVFPIPIPPPTTLSTRSLWVFPVHQPWALVSCIQPGLVICFTLDNIHVSMLFSLNIPPSPSPRVWFSESYGKQKAFMPQKLLLAVVSVFLYVWWCFCFWMVLTSYFQHPYNESLEQLSYIFVVLAQSPSCVWLFTTPWTVACRASPSLNIARSLPKFMSVESLMPSNCEHQMPLFTWTFFIYIVFSYYLFTGMRMHPPQI